MKLASEKSQVIQMQRGSKCSQCPVRTEEPLNSRKTHSEGVNEEMRCELGPEENTRLTQGDTVSKEIPGIGMWPARNPFTDL